MILTGKRVEITGLSSRADLNNTYGTCTKWLADKERYAVLLDDESTLAIKPQNLIDVAAADRTQDLIINAGDAHNEAFGMGCPSAANIAKATASQLASYFVLAPADHEICTQRLEPCTSTLACR